MLLMYVNTNIQLIIVVKSCYTKQTKLQPVIEMMVIGNIIMNNAKSMIGRIKQQQVNSDEQVLEVLKW